MPPGDATLQYVFKVVDRDLREARTLIRDLNKAMAASGKAGRPLASSLDRANAAARRGSRDFDSFGKRAHGALAGLRRQITLLTGLGAGFGLVVGMRAIVGAAIRWEDAFAGVRKTVEGTAPQLAKIEKGLQAMARTIPVSSKELAGIAEQAGQLGIATDAILGFTRVVADLAVTTNLTSEEAGNALARIANITRLPKDKFDELGATIVELGNKSAATEAEIVEFGLRIAGAGHLVGLTQAEILSIGTALSSVGVEAEAGGTAVQRVLLSMNRAVDDGGEKLEAFAAVAGMTAQQFARTFREQPVQAVIAVVEGIDQLRRSGANMGQVLDALGIKDARMVRAILGLAGAQDLLRRTVDTGTRAWQENTALTEEARKRYETTASQLQILRNNLEDAARTIGEGLLPAINDAADSMVDWLGRPETKERLRQLGEDMAHIATVLADVAQAADKVAQAIGGWEGVLSAALGVWLFTRLKRLQAAFTALIGTEAAAGAAGIAGAAGAAARLARVLRGLTAIGAITIGIDLIISKEDRQALAGMLVSFAEKLEDLGVPDWLTVLDDLLGGSIAKAGGATAPGRTQPDVPRKGTAVQIPRTFKPTHQTSNLSGFPAIDIFASPGTPILAPEDGRIVSLRGSGGDRGNVFGYSLYYLGDSGAVYFLTHLAGLMPEGRYKRGDVIGTIGAWQDGDPHVHVGVNQGGGFQIPASTRGPNMARGGTSTPTDGSRGTGQGAGRTSRPPPTKPPALGTIPDEIKLAMEKAKLTPKNLNDDLDALRRAEAFLLKQLAKAKTIKDQLKVTEALAGIRDRIRSILERKGKKTRDRGQVLPAGLREQLTLAEGTDADLRDDLVALRKAEEFLVTLLKKGAKGERRIDLLEELNRIRDRIRGIKDELKQAAAKAKEFAEERAAGLEQINEALAVLRQLPEAAKVQVTDDFGRIVETLNADQLVARLETLRDALRKAVTPEEINRIISEFERLKALGVDAFNELRRHLEELGQTMQDTFVELTDRALQAFDAKAGARLDAIGAKFEALREKIETELQASMDAIEQWRAQLTPSEVELAGLERAERDQRFRDQLAAAEKERADAQAEVDLLIARGASERALAPARERLAQAQKAIDELLLEQKKEALQEQAAAERAERDRQAEEQRQAAEARTEAERESLERQRAAEEREERARTEERRRQFGQRLSDLQAALAKGELTSEEGVARWNALLGEFDLDFAETGLLLGSAFVSAFDVAIRNYFENILPKYLEEKAKVDAAATVAAPLGGIIEQILANPGSMTDAELEALLGNLPAEVVDAILHPGGGGNVVAMQHGAIVRGGRGGVVGLVGEGAHDEAVLPLPPGWRGGSLGGPLHLHFHIDQVIGNDLDEAARQLAEPLRRELLRLGRRNINIGLG